MEYLQKLISALNDEIASTNAERRKDHLSGLPQLRLKILGQSALLANREFSAQMTLNQTRDLDAIIEGDWALRAILKRALEKVNLVFDDLSTEIWVPPGSSFSVVHDESALRIELLDPFYVLLSKALRAPEKNRLLIAQGLSVFGRELAEAIVNGGGTLEFFVGNHE